MGRLNLRKRIFARIMSGAGGSHDSLVAEYKRRLFTGLHGPLTVVEIGPGDGANFAYLPRDPSLRWIGFDPNPYMRPYLMAEAARQHMPAPDLRFGMAEHIDLPDASADAVISTMVLCSVADQTAALREVWRILKPGGRFLFIEHVAAPAGSGQRRRQNWITPLWAFTADGCHPNRETWRTIESSGFADVKYEPFRLPIPIVSPHIAGIATK